MEKSEKREVLVVYTLHIQLCLCWKWLDKCIHPQVKTDDRLVDSLVIVPGIKVHHDSTVITSSSRLYRRIDYIFRYGLRVRWY